MAEFYTITTPIYYVNNVPHIGTALTTFASDVTSRYQKLLGKEPFFITGTDENAIKVFEAAQKVGETPMHYVDRISEEFKKLWALMKIDYHDFIRTTEERHRFAVEECFRVLKKAGYIYLDTYKGWYDVSSATFYKEEELIDGKSPEGNEVRWVEEKNWFFKLSAFKERLLDHITQNPDFILPAVRKNEVISFIKQGLRDVCISRQNQSWGIPVPGDEGRVFYVWFDALMNYIAACGWPNKAVDGQWPAQVQWMGKDILTRFHATLWPAMLMGIGMPLPKHLVGHGWMLLSGEKVSKSKGNVIAPVELAKILQDKTGCSFDLSMDAMRHYMGITMPFETDYAFTYEDFEKRYNADLANDLGNALNRSLAMCHKFFGGVIPDGTVEPEVQSVIHEAKIEYSEAMKEFRIDRATEVSMALVRFLNKYIDRRAPWSLAKNSDPSLKAVLRSMLLTIRSIGGLISPVQPTASEELARQLGLGPICSWDQIGNEASLPAGQKVEVPRPLFPRIDLKKINPEQLMNAQTTAPQQTAPLLEEKDGLISIADFTKVKMQVGRILEVEEMPKSKKLYKMQVKVGEETRQILAGLKEFFTADELKNKQVIVVTNLVPASLMGIESQGMILAAQGTGERPVLLCPELEIPDGAFIR